MILDCNQLLLIFRSVQLLFPALLPSVLNSVFEIPTDGSSPQELSVWIGHKINAMFGSPVGISQHHLRRGFAVR